MVNFDCNFPALPPEVKNHLPSALPLGVYLYPILPFDYSQYSWDAAAFDAEGLILFQLRFFQKYEFLYFED
jgi:hypothetical protein